MSSLLTSTRSPVNQVQALDDSSQADSAPPAPQKPSAQQQQQEKKQALRPCDLVDDIHCSRWHSVNASCRRIISDEPHLRLKDFQRPMLMALKEVGTLPISSGETVAQQAYASKATRSVYK
jgi:hypothetical protein